MRLIILFLLFVSRISIANELLPQNESERVYVKLGNIYYQQTSGQTIQITHLGGDSAPILSFNRKLIAFIRTGNQQVPESCERSTDSQFGEQIWVYNISTKKEHLIVANNFQCNKPEKQIINPSDLCFSPDDKMLYFITAAWVTSGALHGVRINDAVQHYITPANEVQIVSKGTYQGYLIVNQHRYFIGGGSYDWYWLINPAGKEEGPIGPEISKDQMDFIESKI